MGRPIKNDLRRLVEKINKTETCWLYTGWCNERGYGRIALNQRGTYAHRAAWILFRGEIPDGMQVLHKCDVRNCVNPDHLFLGNNDINMKDRDDKNRVQHGERHYLSKLNDTSVVETRKRYAKGGITCRELANEFGVSPQTINVMLRGKTWKRAAGPIFCSTNP